MAAKNRAINIRHMATRHRVLQYGCSLPFVIYKEQCLEQCRWLLCGAMDAVYLVYLVFGYSAWKFTGRGARA